MFRILHILLKIYFVVTALFKHFEADFLLIQVEGWYPFTKEKKKTWMNGKNICKTKWVHVLTCFFSTYYERMSESEWEWVNEWTKHELPFLHISYQYIKHGGIADF